MKPSWNDAPEWARWLSCDPDGTWRWHSERPYLIWVSDKDWYPVGKTEPMKPAKMLEERP